MEKHCPEEFEIDTAGCRHRWEGKVLLPFINYEHIQKLYQKYSHKIAGEDMKRNLLGKTYRYAKNSSEYMFKSFYGNFPCSVVANVIDL
jgi:5'-3' exonuclease